MMMKPGKAAAVVQNFFDAYLLRCDPEQALACLAEDIQWLGAGKGEIIRGHAGVEALLRAAIAQMSAPLTISCSQINEIFSEGSVAAVLMDAAACTEGRGDAAVRFQVSAACRKDGGVWRIASLHASAPDSRQKTGEFFPSACLNRTEMDTQMASQALDILGKSIPGGILGGYLEPDFPLYYVNDRILSYLGYTYDEFIDVTNGKVINCIHPGDRERVASIVTAEHCTGEDYEFQYRMLKKDGCYIWANAIGKRGKSEDGRAVCISVIRDISSNVEANERLEQQAAEQKRQTLRYDHLFQSVLCGIVQYRMDGQCVIFKSANREAIRIFGYTPEVFWSKKEWNLTELIDEEDLRPILKAEKKLQKVGDKVSFEYCLHRKKKGETCWIIGSAEILLDSEGEAIIQGVYLDNTERKMAELRNRRLTEQVEASNEILHLALENTNTCEFYYYPRSGECMVPERTADIFHSQAYYENMPYSFALEQIDAAYHSAFYGMYEQILRGEQTAACEFKSLDGQLWCRNSLSVILRDDNDEPQLVVGIVENITRQKEMEAAFLTAQSRDGLTGLYNKEAGVQLIQDYLMHREPSENGVLMLLDMDDFGKIDQAEGHVYTDALLQEVAEVLQSETGPDNIQIRLGGDEFMLFIKHRTKSEAMVEGARIVERIQGMLAHTEKDFQISASIGMCSTDVTNEYSALYRCAESALKYSKAQRKGQAVSYSTASSELGVLLTELYTEAYPINDIEHEAFRQGDDLVSFALDLLGKARNLDDAVFLLLLRIGKT